VLVVGATGGVGTQVVQHTAEGRELVTKLGAASTVDYTGDVHLGRV
jgi:hypothetical protein